MDGALTSADVKYTFDSILDQNRYFAEARFARADSIHRRSRRRHRYFSFERTVRRISVGNRAACDRDRSRRARAADFSAGSWAPARFDLSARSRMTTWCWSATALISAVRRKFHGVRFRVVPEAIVRALELRKGSADVEVNSLTPDMIPVLRAATDARCDRTARNQLLSIWRSILTTRRWRKREVRQALAYATNREEIINICIAARRRPADGPLPTKQLGVRTRDPEIRVTIRNRRSDCWTRLGFRGSLPTGGMRVKLTLKTSTEESSRLLAAVLQEQWRKVGVDLDVQAAGIRDVVFGHGARKFRDLYTLRWIGANNDPDTFFEYVFDSQEDSAMRGPIADTIAMRKSMRCSIRRAWRPIRKSGANCSAKCRKSSRRICLTSACGSWTT